MKKFIIWFAILISAFPTLVSAIGFGGYYTMSFPFVAYNSTDGGVDHFGLSFLGFCVKGRFDINQKLGIECTGTFSKYPHEWMGRLLDAPGSYYPEDLFFWSIRFGGIYDLPVEIIPLYCTGGVGLYHVSVTESRYDPVEIHFEKSYPGIYVGAGMKVKLFSPLSLDVSPTYSYVLGTGGEGDKLKRLSTFDINIGMAVDL